VTYIIQIPKVLRDLAPIKREHKRLSQALAHIIDYVDEQGFEVLMSEHDSIGDGWDLGIRYSGEDSFRTELAIVAINKKRVDQ